MLPAQVQIREWGERVVDSRLAERADYIAIGTGVAQTLAIDAAGVPLGWGWNSGGECELPLLPLGARAVQVAGGDRFSLVLTDQGAILHCGADGYGQAQVPALPFGVRYVKIAACNEHAAALRSDGWIEVWGDDWGLGPQFPSMRSVPALPIGMVYTDVAICGYDVVGLRSDGRILVWGTGAYGMSLVPQPPTGRHVVAIDADSIQNGSHALALLDDGNILAWGDNSFGQSTVPQLLPNMSYVKIAAGPLHSVALRSDGELVVWGGADPSVLTIPTLPSGVRWVDIAAGSDYTIGLRSDGRVQTFGRITYCVSDNCPAPPLGGGYVTAASNYFHVVSLRSDDTVRAWGLDSFGQCGAPAAPSFRGVAAGNYHSLALHKNGTIAAWGDNAFGQCNVPPLGAGLTYTALAAGTVHSAALISDGTAVIWGSANSHVVAPPPPGTRYERVAAYGMDTVLLRSDGAVMQNGMMWPLPNEVITNIALGSVLTRRLRDGTLQQGTVPYCTTCNVPPLPFGVCYVEMSTGGSNGKTFAARRSDGQIVIWGQPWHRQDSIPTLLPGETWLGVNVAHDTIVATYGPESTFVSFGSGCAGSRPSTRLIPIDTPRIGRMLQVEVDNLPQNVAILVAGWSRIPGGVSLAAAGMPGCYWHIANDATVLLVGTGGWARHELPIPRLSALVGATLFEQAVVLDSTAGNQIGLVVSDAAKFVVGPW